MKQKQVVKSVNGWELATIADGSLSCENINLGSDDIRKIEEILKPGFSEKMKKYHVYISYDNWSGVYIMHLPGLKSRKGDALIKEIYAFLSEIPVPSKEYFFISCKKTIDKQKLYDFIQVLLKYDTPTKISSHEYRNGGKNRYFPKRLNEAFDAEMTEANERKFLSLSGEKITFTIRSERCDEAVLLILLIDNDISDKLYPKLEELINEEAVMAFETDSHDHDIQNQSEINMLEWMGENSKDYPKRKSSRDNVMEIDIQKNPGYVYKVKGYRFCATYRMWFGSDSYRIFDRDVLRNFSCFENVVTGNDVTRVTLYENIKDYRDNREKQWKFRKALHIDEIAQKMIEEEKEDYKQSADPEVNIMEGEFEHGGVRLIQTFLKDGEIAHRSDADSVEERELDANGKEVFKIVKELR